MTDPLALSLIVIGMFAVFCWALACIFRDASIADLFWPLYHALAATTYLYLAPAEEASTLAVVFYLLICLWASRLFLHLFFRRLGQGEDHRYAAIRERNREHFWWQSFFTIFLMQSALAWLICVPFSTVILNAQSFSVLHGLGLFFMAIGLTYEWVADQQLKIYLRKNSTDDGEKPACWLKDYGSFLAIRTISVIGHSGLGQPLLQSPRAGDGFGLRFLTSLSFIGY